ncbi:MAG: His/Gly/Thr/Pro-type tRNA ligase C-terminal domain-containing protein [Candidatus Pacebacteria bacterium]|jgi:prolyl-tRNA synthetase|nr:prolyl-tRNA synthetase [Parcubacteria group bacterium]MDP6249236.1 His/Gly/Thr/Pro-type tRNA ligase C-terminal domain-containing protein [Candidatus Paceibacterota bacterium]MDP7159044.1 His/Gly/Thr/Pro-type tRNA ligase C-terminal domain-containing protein [Candidatus Paceibacterota bacterium]MDP7366622.1 His/Gly/Thr/Pro-type tRNA ligase C-terminal domain-containing protein [Candidatus Paceibacterota bacterium]MDP7466094.1 His/Gly/Thr/Pro-type tRNA ligase C-terminal domain-containing protein|tara:strand:- start:19218 stop:20438 length:1221 start_codon:yes stop_codon:yes gene_type:complete
MLQSTLFSKTRKEAPSDEVSKNAQLLVRGGFIHKEIAGVYTYLPLGLRVLNKIENIIREEMNVIGGQEVFMTTLQDPEIWKKSDRWDDEKIDNWFKTKLKNENELGIANTHEEPLAKLLTDHVNSYKDLPLYVYQIQTKFRNELRAKSGLMRGREFLMKDLYSFSRTEEEHKEFYEKAAETYKKIFNRVGLGDKTYRTFASGGSFSKFSDEFQTLSRAGEDTIYIDEKKGVAVNKEVFTDDVLAELGLEKAKLVEKKAIEVGNIFPLGTKYSEAQGLLFRGEDGKDKPVVMGSYGIGLGRVMGTVAEVLSDDKGLIWPLSIAPFKVHLIGLSDASDLYNKLKEAGVEVLYDDRDLQAGQKFADADLIGVPYRVVVSERNAGSGKFEFTNRATGETKEITEDELLKM